MPTIQITIRDKIASAAGAPAIICGNSDYTVQFDLDEEWTPYAVKTARFNYTRDGIRLHQDVLLTGNSCTAPVMHDVHEVGIGLYAGALHTSTPARIPCERSATDDAALHPYPMPDIYDQLLHYLTTPVEEPFTVSDVIPIADSALEEELIIAIAEKED